MQNHYVISELILLSIVLNCNSNSYITHETLTIVNLDSVHMCAVLHGVKNR